MRIHIIRGKVVNIKSVDLAAMSARKHESCKKNFDNVIYDFFMVKQYICTKKCISIFISKKMR